MQLFYRFTTNFCYLDLKSCYMCVLRSVSKLTLVTWILSYRMCVSWSICPITNFGHLDLKLLNVCFTICFVVHVCFMICFEILIRFFTVELLSMRSILILWFKNVIYFMWFSINIKNFLLFWIFVFCFWIFIVKSVNFYFIINIKWIKRVSI